MLPKSLHAVNEGIAFLLELVALGALCWWGFHVGHNLGVHLLLGLGAPALMIVVWGRFAAPRAKVKLQRPALLTVKTLVFTAAAVAMYATGWHVAGIVFWIVSTANSAIAAMDRDALVNRMREDG